MAVLFKDFLPETQEHSNFFGGRDIYYQGLETAAAMMNDWIAEHDITVVSIETVSLPNIHNEGEDGSTDTELPTRGYVLWYQFIRVWYQAR